MLTFLRNVIATTEAKISHGYFKRFISHLRNRRAHKHITCEHINTLQICRLAECWAAQLKVGWSSQILNFDKPYRDCMRLVCVYQRLMFLICSLDKTLFHLQCSAVLWDCLHRCWSKNIYLVPLCHRFWKLTLQLLSRYAVWTAEVQEEVSWIYHIYMN